MLLQQELSTYIMTITKKKKGKSNISYYISTYYAKKTKTNKKNVDTAMHAVTLLILLLLLLLKFIFIIKFIFLFPYEK